jgi:hypothetical protein
MKVLLILSVLSSLLGAGCASIGHGRYQQVAINSNPSGANVSVDCDGGGNHPAGQTPTTVSLKRNADPCKVNLSKDGYEDSSVVFARAVSGWIWGNVLFGGIPGWIIDAADGAMYNRVPDSASVTLVKKGS